MAFTKKASSNTEVIIGQAANKLNKGLAELKETAQTLIQLSEKSEELTAKIATSEEKIKDLDIEFAEKKRQKEVELSISMKENAQKQVEAILSAEGKVAVVEKDYENLQNSFLQLKSDLQKEISKEVAIVTSKLKAENEQLERLTKAEYEAQQAKVQAELSMKDQQIKFLETQVENWKDALDEERKAGVERAKSSAIGTLNLAGNK